MHLRRHTGRHNMRDRRLHLVFPTRDHLALAILHRLKTLLRDESGTVLLIGPDLGIEHIGAGEELSFSGARHQAGDGATAFLYLMTQSERETVEKGLGAVVDRLIRPWHETGDRARDQYLSFTTRAHVTADLLDEIERAHDVGIDHARPGFEFLIEKALAEPDAGIGKQCRNWPPLQSGVDLFAAFRRCQVSLESLNRGAACRQLG